MDLEISAKIVGFEESREIDPKWENGECVALVPRLGSDRHYLVVEAKGIKFQAQVEESVYVQVLGLTPERPST